MRTKHNVAHLCPMNVLSAKRQASTSSLQEQIRDTASQFRVFHLNMELYKLCYLRITYLVPDSEPLLLELTHHPYADHSKRWVRH